MIVIGRDGYISAPGGDAAPQATRSFTWWYLALAAVSRVGMTVADVLALIPFVRTFKETARHVA